jgi:hypothetical protein
MRFQKLFSVSYRYPENTTAGTSIAVSSIVDDEKNGLAEVFNYVQFINPLLHQKCRLGVTTFTSSALCYATH